MRVCHTIVTVMVAGEAPRHLTKMSDPKFGILGHFSHRFWPILRGFRRTKIGPSLQVHFPSHYGSNLSGDDPP